MEKNSLDLAEPSTDNSEQVIRPDPFVLITDAILALLERGVVPWRQPWAKRQARPTNLFTRKPYRGINVLLLACLSYGSPYFVTENQARRLKGRVRADEVGHPIIFYDIFSSRSEESADPVRRYINTVYIVYNIEQCEGIKDPSADAKADEFEPIKEAAQILEGMPKRPKIHHGGDKACYWPSTDVVNLPTPESFEPREEYYSTAFHELVHATGHRIRLNRKSLVSYTPFASGAYSREELVAEIGAAFLCAAARIDCKTLENSAAYISGWLSRMQNDKRLVVIASGSAQRATDYILNRIKTKE